MSEAVTLKKIMLEASRLGLRVFRNQVGGYKLSDGRFLQSGLCKGSSDLIGWTKDGKFCAIEVKAVGKQPTKEQVIFIENVKKAGGFACILDDEKKLEKALAEFEKQ